MSSVSMEKFLSSYPSPQEGLDTLGLADIFDLIDAVDVREESTAADSLAERMALAKSEHGIRDTWAWIQRNFGLSHSRVGKIITRRPVGHLQHHLRHVTTLGLRPGFRFEQLQQIWEILREVPEGFLYGDDFQLQRERFDTTLEQYLPDAVSSELFWLCLHASLDPLLGEVRRKEAASQARRVLTSTMEALEELWLLDPYGGDQPISMWEYVGKVDDYYEPAVEEDDDPIVMLDIEAIGTSFIDDDGIDDEPIGPEAMDAEDIFASAILKRYGRQTADLLF